MVGKKSQVANATQPTSDARQMAEAFTAFVLRLVVSTSSAAETAESWLTSVLPFEQNSKNNLDAHSLGVAASNMFSLRRAGRIR